MNNPVFGKTDETVPYLSIIAEQRPRRCTIELVRDHNLSNNIDQT